MANNCIIVLPIYKERPSELEAASFRQLFKILGKHKICIFTYEDLDLTFYKKEADILGGRFQVEYFDKKYFESVLGYNSLCYTKDFYLRFSEYKYMMIYQLDVWVFRDELIFWCEKDYDYIGAPLFWSIEKGEYTTKFMGVGNGGFCIRKIEYCLNLLNKQKKRIYFTPGWLLKMYYNLFKYNKKFNSLSKKIIGALICIAKIFGIWNTAGYFIKKPIMEDGFFSMNNQHIWGGKINLPGLEEAAKFSFEANPSLLYKICGNQLPFGCHAFAKHEFNSFWKNFIITD